MAIGILSSGVSQAALYDTVTMTAFGPVMPNAMWAEAFVEWLSPVDPRIIGQEVFGKWDEFESAHEECSSCGVAISPKCGLCRECCDTGDL